MAYNRHQTRPLRSAFSAFRLMSKCRRNAGNLDSALEPQGQRTWGPFTSTTARLSLHSLWQWKVLADYLNPIEINFDHGNFPLLCWACWLMASVVPYSASETTTIAC